MSGSLLRVAGLALLWGSSFLWIKIALRGFPPTQITMVRLALGAVVLAGWLYLIGGRLPRGVRLWLHLAIAASVANVAPYLLFAVGEQQVDSGVAGILNATTPIWTALLAVLVKQERSPNPRKAAGLGLGITGTLLIFAPWQTGSQFWTLGAFACLAAAVSYAVSYVYMARFLAPQRLSALELSASQLIAATVISVALTPLLGGWQAPEWDSSAIAALLTLSISTGLAYVLNYRLIQENGATAASVVVYLLPVVAILLGWLVLAEVPALHSITGVAVVLAGVALARPAPTPTTASMTSLRACVTDQSRDVGDTSRWTSRHPGMRMDPFGGPDAWLPSVGSQTCSSPSTPTSPWSRRGCQLSRSPPGWASSQMR